MSSDLAIRRKQRERDPVQEGVARLRAGSLDVRSLAVPRLRAILKAYLGPADLNRAKSRLEVARGFYIDAHTVDWRKRWCWEALCYHVALGEFGGDEAMADLDALILEQLRTLDEPNSRQWSQAKRDLWRAYLGAGCFWGPAVNGLVRELCPDHKCHLLMRWLVEGLPLSQSVFWSDLAHETAHTLAAESWHLGLDCRSCPTIF